MLESRKSYMPESATESSTSMNLACMPALPTLHLMGTKKVNVLQPRALHQRNLQLDASPWSSPTSPAAARDMIRLPTLHTKIFLQPQNSGSGIPTILLQPGRSDSVAASRPPVGQEQAMQGLPSKTIPAVRTTAPLQPERSDSMAASRPPSRASASHATTPSQLLQ